MHEPITIEDPTRDGTGRTVLFHALHAHMRWAATKAATFPVGTSQHDVLKRDALDAANLMKAIYPNDTRQVDRVLAQFPWLTQEVNDAGG